MQQLWPFVVTALVGFLLGSLPTGWIVARAYKVDIQSVGSGNIGATNVMRTIGKGPGLFVLGMDAAKGYLACRWIGRLVLAQFFPKGTEVPELLTEYLPVVAGFAAILGHNFTPWLGFRGGKGIATSAGVLAAWMPLAFLLAVLVWLLVFAVSGYVSLGSIAAAIALPFAVWITGGTKAFIIIAAVIGALAVVKHRSNIRRLRAGTEQKFGKRSGRIEERVREES